MISLVNSLSSSSRIAQIELVKHTVVAQKNNVQDFHEILNSSIQNYKKKIELLLVVNNLHTLQ